MSEWQTLKNKHLIRIGYLKKYNENENQTNKLTTLDYFYH